MVQKSVNVNNHGNITAALIHARFPTQELVKQEKKKKANLFNFLSFISENTLMKIIKRTLNVISISRSVRPCTFNSTVGYNRLFIIRGCEYQED